MSGGLERAAIGIVPIVWNNADLLDLGPPVPSDEVLDEIARLRYSGCQLGRGFPAGRELAAALAARGLRLAEAYVDLPCTPDGPASDAPRRADARLAQLVAADGDVLVVAVDRTADRAARIGRASEPGASRLTDDGWRRLAGLLHELAEAAQRAGVRLAFHAHAGTLVETPDELDRLAAETDPGLVDLCLDVGHTIVGGGDPVAVLRRHGDRVGHVHLKDVDPLVLDRLRTGGLEGWEAALRARIFTELGAGTLDLEGCLAALAERDYGGWLMVEQDTTWLRPSESAAIARGVLDYAIRRLRRADAA